MDSNDECPVCKQDHLTRWVCSLTDDVIEMAIQCEVMDVKKSKRPHLERHIRNVINKIKRDRKDLDARIDS